MIYRLTCPSCQKAADHPFVRAGAVASCPGCAAVWRIEPAHVARLNEATGRVAQGADAGEPVEAPRVPPPRITGNSSGDTAMVGLSGLSEVMSRGGDGEAEELALEPDNGPPEASLRSAPSAGGTAGVAGMKPRSAHDRALDAERRRRRRTLLTLVLGLTVMVGVLGAVVAMMAAREDEASIDGPAGVAGPHQPARVAALLSLDDPVLAQAPRRDVRAVAQRGTDPELLLIRLTATEPEAPPPFELIVTVIREGGGMTHAWHVTEPRPLHRGEDLYLTAHLINPPQIDQSLSWIVTAIRLENPGGGGPGTDDQRDSSGGVAPRPRRGAAADAADPPPPAD